MRNVGWYSTRLLEVGRGEAIAQPTTNPNVDGEIAVLADELRSD